VTANLLSLYASLAIPMPDLRFDVSGLCRRTLVSPVPTSQMHRSGWANAAASLSSVFGLGFVD
jgi:hypothetical protein